MSGTGLVTAIGTGMATITITSLATPSKSATASITVGAPNSGTLQLAIENLPAEEGRTSVGVGLQGPSGAISLGAPTTGNSGSLTLSGLAPGSYTLKAAQVMSSFPAPNGVIFTAPAQTIIITAGATTRATQTYALATVPLRVSFAGVQGAICDGLQVTLPSGEILRRGANFAPLLNMQSVTILYYAGATQFSCADQVIGGRIYRTTAPLYSFTTTPSTTPYDVLVTYAPVP